ncbi:hypothetical protein NLI96_g13018 [Meripilus lineatus]|uniref:Uncharacterized protein n=1 Tax=Meripilus lineatus TaxID=2056292 RepID=A0AAD5UQ58_9APHY|nr:hypothetical protein NLI96_g13018 [Physisporinus lineatus]
MTDSSEDNTNYLQSLIDTHPQHVIDGKRWVAIGGAVEMIPKEEERPTPGSREHLCRPHLYAPLQPYLPYIPNARLRSDLTSLSWIFRPTPDKKSVLQGPEYARIKEDLLTSIKEHYHSVRDLLQSLSHGIGVNLRLFDQGYQPEILASREGVEDVWAELTKAKEGMVILLAICRMGLTLAGTDLRRDALARHSDYLRTWDWGMPPVGVILVVDDPLTRLAPLLELRQNNVPVYVQMSDDPSTTDGRGSHSIPVEGTPPVVPTGAESSIDRPGGSSRSDPLFPHLLHFLDSIPPFRPLSEPLGPVRVWSDKIIENAHLVIDPFPEIILCLQAILEELTPEQILSRAVQKGISFKLVAPIQALQLMLPDGFNTEEGLPPYLDRAYVDRPLMFSPDLVALWAQYRVRVHDLLLRPHAVAFIPKGSVEWRLAIHFAGPRLLKSLHSQFSTIVAGHHHGYPYAYGYLGDDVTLQESLVLLGTCVDYSSGFGRYGEWTRENEAWFQERLLYVSSGSALARPLTEAEWIDQLLAISGYAAEPQYDPVVQDSKAAYLRCRLEQEQGAWQMRRLKFLP